MVGSRRSLRTSRRVRTVKIAVLKSAEGKLNENQRTLIETLAASGGRAQVSALQSLEIPRTTLATLAAEASSRFWKSCGVRSLSFQAAAIALRLRFESRPTVGAQADKRRCRSAQISGMLLHGVTGSGKTAVYLAAMRAVLEAGRSAILLVPKSVSHRQSQPTCTRSSAMKSPFYTLHCPT